MERCVVTFECRSECETSESVVWGSGKADERGECGSMSTSKDEAVVTVGISVASGTTLTKFGWMVLVNSPTLKGEYRR